MSRHDHWETVHTSKRADAVSWYEAHAEHSLRLIAETGLPLDAPIIDVGGGASTLVDDLLARGHSRLTVLDISEAALATARARLGAKAAAIEWLAGDVTALALPAAAYALWHDRAVFHFLTEAADRQAYLAQLRAALRPGGQVIVATFAEDGPEKCSGLPVRRYSAAALAAEFGPGFALRSARREAHQTPFGTTQWFTYCRLERGD